MLDRPETTELVSQAEHEEHSLLKHHLTPTQCFHTATTILNLGPCSLLVAALPQGDAKLYVYLYSAACYYGDIAILLSSSPDLSQQFKLVEIATKVSSTEKQTKCVLCFMLFGFFLFWTTVVQRSNQPLETKLW